MNEKEITRPTVMEVDISNFRYNTEQIRKKLKPNTKLMPVIKANAYGTHLNTRLEVLNEFEIVALATVDEGVQVRNIGYQKEIFILNQPSISEIDKIIENNLVIGLSSNEFLKEVQKRNKVIKVHLEIETGMGRTGIAIQQIDTFLNQIQKTNTIKEEGIYTHLSSPDIDEQYTKDRFGIVSRLELYTKEQLETFQKAVEIITKQIKDIKYIHTSASNGIINYPNAQYNLVRPGMILYGYESAEGIGEKISLKPVAKLKSKITFIKTVSEGTSISYARTFKTKKESKIATIPIGYADGLRRSLSNNGYVIINRKKVPIVGKVCMDSFMADVTELENVKVGDDVWIWDNEIIKLEEVAKRCDTINYEIISTISVRVPRKFLNK